MDYGLGNVSDASLEQAFSTYDPDAASFWNVGLFETKSAAKTFGQNTGYVSLANGVIGAVGSIATGYYNSRIQKAQQEMAIRVQEYNARQAERAAQSALMSSNFKIGQISEKFEKVKSSQKAAMAANGIVLGLQPKWLLRPTSTSADRSITSMPTVIQRLPSIGCRGSMPRRRRPLPPWARSTLSKAWATPLQP